MLAEGRSKDRDDDSVPLFARTEPSTVHMAAQARNPAATLWQDGKSRWFALANETIHCPWKSNAEFFLSRRDPHCLSSMQPAVWSPLVRGWRSMSRQEEQMSKVQTLNQTLAEFQAKRAETMPADKLKINVDQRRLLVDTADRSGFVKAGEKVGPIALTEVDGGPLSLDALLKSGPAVLIFFRFAGCPACNIALPYYNQHLAPKLRAHGATLVGVSPQVPEKLRDIKHRHKLDFLIASDTDNSLARRFGILYAFDEASRRLSIESGSPIGDVTGTGTWELPMPATIVIDQTGTVRFSDVSPDWLVRTEPIDVIAAVQAVTARAAA
jgi:peroxiredoxin